MVYAPTPKKGSRDASTNSIAQKNIHTTLHTKNFLDMNIDIHDMRPQREYVDELQEVYDGFKLSFTP